MNELEDKIKKYKLDTLLLLIAEVSRNMYRDSIFLKK